MLEPNSTAMVVVVAAAAAVVVYALVRSQRRVARAVLSVVLLVTGLFGGLAYLWPPSAFFAAAIGLIGLWYQWDATRTGWR